MPNTRQALKRVRQTQKRTTTNRSAKSNARTALRKAIEAITKKDLDKAKEAYVAAVKTLSKAGSKGAIPRVRAARKISRLTHLAKKILPDSLNFTAK